jgi:hypothetical protein
MLTLTTEITQHAVHLELAEQDAANLDRDDNVTNDSPSTTTSAWQC